MFRSAWLIVVLMGATAVPAQAEPTDVSVRALSRGAKFVGTSMGGVRIVIRDAATGEILAQGLTRGTTGDTKRIMNAARFGVLSDPDSAVFRATFDLDEPRLVEIEAFGPVAQRQAAVRVTTQRWLLPGRHLSAGDGVVLELPGYAVDVLQPSAHQRFATGTREVKLRSNVVLMCGCPLEPGGTWDANRTQVEATIKLEGKAIERIALAYAGSPSQFEGRVAIAKPGSYEAVITAYDPVSGNTGVDRTTFVVAP